MALLGNNKLGLLGNMSPYQQPGAIPFAQDPAMTAIGAGLLGGMGMDGKFDFSAVPQAMAQRGVMQDSRARLAEAKAERDRKEAEAAQRRAAMTAVIKSWKGLSPQERAFYQINPGAFDPTKIGGAGGPYEGSGLDAQNWNIALNAHSTGQFDTPEYAAAYSQLTQPRTVQVQTDEGLKLIEQPPNVPGWLKPPTGAAPVATPPSPAPEVSTADGGIVPGTNKSTESIRTERARAQQAYSAIDSELTRYVELVGETGVEAMPGPAKDQLNTVRQGIMLQLKELFNLGVLNGPDLELMERMIYDPTFNPSKGIGAAADQAVTAVGGMLGIVPDASDRAQSSADELRRMLKNIIDSKSGGAPAPAQQPATDDPLGIR